MKRQLIVAAALLALSACEKKPAAPAAEDGPTAETTSEGSAPETDAPFSDPAATPIEGDPASAWVELMGVWAETGRCEDDLGRWIIEAEAFHLFEMHCAVEKLDLLQNGVKATAQCTVEGDNDGTADVYWFLRQGDGSLTIVQEANDAMTAGLFLCEGEETEL